MSVLIKKEINDIFKNKLFLLTAVLLLILSVVAVILGAIQIRSSMLDYNNSISYLQSLGKTTLPEMPNINPLAISKAYVNYLGMVGALIAIILGNHTLIKEREQGTLRLILSRGIFRDQLLTAKIIGNAIVMAAITLILATFTIVTIYAIGQVPLNVDDLLRLGLFFLMSLLYMLFFYSLSLALTLMTKNGRQAMLIAIIVWIIFAFVLPQIGDTMDMDNQLPGGFFSSMGLQTSQESQILSHFKTYETIRNGIEELSPLKHYERMSFALMNIKPGFDQMTGLQVVATKWIDLLGVFTPMIVFGFLSYGLFLKKENIY